MKPIEIQNLDQHLKPLQVDGVSTGLELSTEGFRISSGELEIKTLTSETAKVNENLVVGEQIKSNIITTAGNIVSGDDIAVASTGKLSLDGIGGHTYMVESSDDTVRLYVGGDIIMQIQENGADGNQINFSDCSAGFTQLEPTYGSFATVVDFRASNKHNLTFGAGNITTVQLRFPSMSGNFTLLLKQDGTGSRTVTNWNAYESDESAADGSATVVWAGGSAPTLTTDANHVDILSFYWDADNEIAYGVATLDFQF
tara:strand:- start:234 stop:1001 length:768 start_codon:yes stop_codon:yes gene_type:complete